MADDNATETQITTDSEQVKSWARDARVVPVREGDRVRFTDEGEFDDERGDRVDWPDFDRTLSETNNVVLYHGHDERPALEVHSRDDMQATLDDDAHKHLDEGRVLSRPTDEISTSPPAHEGTAPERAHPTDEDEGKAVVDTQGTKLGMVKTVEGSQLYVDPQPGLAQSVLSKLGWNDADESDYVLGADEIVLIEEDRVEVETP